jgi:membrane-bound lytic murein transglycosylase D
MKVRGYGRTFVVGVVALVVALTTVWAINRDGVPIESAPAEELLELVAAESEVAEGVGEPTWDLTVTSNDRVDFWIDFLKGRNYDKTRLWLERSGRYAPMIRGELRARGMPEDLLYLALIESGFSPRAYSRAHASGIWQFIEETGRRYGLRVSSYLDERRDPVKSTVAALDYLEELYDRFGSWYLAAAAYNTGENRVDRILRERVGGKRGDDALFWRIAPYLPRETRDYVPLMLAAGYIAKEPAKYGFEDLEYHAPLEYEAVSVPSATTLRSIARAAGISQEEVQDLNPHLLQGVTPPGQNWSVRLPRGRSETYAHNIERVLAEERLATVEHTVRRGETLSHIAQRYGTSVSALQAANVGIQPRRIHVGQRVRVPARTQIAATAAATPQPRTRWTSHRVRRGDSLWSISRRYGVTIRELQSWNRMGRTSTIKIGQSLRIQA